MQITTNIGPMPRHALVEAFQNDIHEVDSGINLICLNTDWGCTLIPTRQGRKLSWRITMTAAGQCGIYKPASSTIPAVQINLDKNQHVLLRDYFQCFIRKGWV